MAEMAIIWPIGTTVTDRNAHLFLRVRPIDTFQNGFGYPDLI